MTADSKRHQRERQTEVDTDREADPSSPLFSPDNPPLSRSLAPLTPLQPRHHTGLLSWAHPLHCFCKVRKWQRGQEMRPQDSPVPTHPRALSPRPADVQGAVRRKEGQEEPGHRDRSQVDPKMDVRTRVGKPSFQERHPRWKMQWGWNCQ